MKDFAEALKKEANITFTENGATALKSTGSACLDFFSIIGGMRNSSTAEIVNSFKKAYDEHPLAAIRLLFYTRDIRDGYGERNSFRKILSFLGDYAPETIEKNIYAIPEFGRWDDLYALVGTKAEKTMWSFMKNQFDFDLYNMSYNKPISLLVKWLATPNASSKRTAVLGRLTARKLGYKGRPTEYRHLMTIMRSYIDVVEQKMSQKKWSAIDYETVPSCCMLKNSNAFMRNDRERFCDFKNKVNDGKAKVNAAILTPYDVVKQLGKVDGDVLDMLWKKIPTVCDHNVLVMCDTSGSMWGKPLQIAISLSMFFAERNAGVFKDVFLTFSEDPEVVVMKGKTLEEKYYNISTADWGYNTNLQRAFSRILRIAVMNKVQPHDMPEELIVITDMEIDPYLMEDKKDFTQSMKKEFAKYGYNLPAVTYWNVNAKGQKFLASASEDGVSLVSGYSPNVLKQVIENIGKAPMTLMLNIVYSDRYKGITV
jgi:hypothetical protein